MSEANQKIEKKSEDPVPVENVETPDASEDQVVIVGESPTGKESHTTLILSDEDVLDSKPVDEKNAKESNNKKKKNGLTSKFLWVSNITKETKAVDLKKLFNMHANVASAKIVTNGKAYFGYIGLENSDMVEKCVKELNNYKLNSRRLVVSRQRPDLKSKTKAPEEVVKRKKVENAEKVLVVKIEKVDDDEQVQTVPVEKAETPKDKDKEKDKQKEKDAKKRDDDKERIKKLTNELKESGYEVRYLRRKLDDYKTKYETESRRNRDLQRRLEKNDLDLKNERRRLSLEREQIQKREKVDQIRYDADRALLNRELDECKKLREYLQRKIDELGRKRRQEMSRSPVRKRASPLVASRQEEPKRRSPPPPPKLSSSKQRVVDRQIEKRPRYRSGESAVSSQIGRPNHWSPPNFSHGSQPSWSQQAAPPPPQFNSASYGMQRPRDQVFYPQFKNGGPSSSYGHQFQPTDRRY